MNKDKYAKKIHLVKGYIEAIRHQSELLEDLVTRTWDNAGEDDIGIIIEAVIDDINTVSLNINGLGRSMSEITEDLRAMAENEE